MEQSQNTVTLPVELANKALAKEEVLDELVEKGIVDIDLLNEFVKENPFWEKHIHY